MTTGDGASGRGGGGGWRRPAGSLPAAVTWCLVDRTPDDERIRGVGAGQRPDSSPQQPTTLCTPPPQPPARKDISERGALAGPYGRRGPQRPPTRRDGVGVTRAGSAQRAGAHRNRVPLGPAYH